MWYQQGHNILLQYWSGLQKFVSYFTKKLKKNQGESNNPQWTCDQWDLLLNQHQRMHGVQKETELSRKGHRRECPSSIEECVEQQHSESIVEQTDTGSPDEQHKSEYLQAAVARGRTLNWQVFGLPDL